MADLYVYRGCYKVKVLTQSEDYWIVKTQEDFEDKINGEKVAVKTGEQHIEPVNELYKRNGTPLPVLSMYA